MRVQTRSPRLEVTLVTKLLGPITETEGAALWRILQNSVIEAVTRKSFGEVAGSFQLSLVPRRLPPSPEYQADATWTDILQPGDYVEITMHVPPRRPDRPVMRGFIDNVGAQFSIAEGHPQQIIPVGGRDYGTIPLLAKRYYLDKPLAANVAIFRQWADAARTIFGWSKHDPDVLPPPEADQLAPRQTSNGPVFKPAEIEAALWQLFVEPQQALVRFSFPGADRIPAAQFAPLVDDWEEFLDCVDPRTNPLAVDPMTDVWSVMVDYQHAPWRELFFEEQTNKPLLIYRPTPWLDRGGNYVQPPSGWHSPGIPGTAPLTPEVITRDLANTEIVESSLVRSVGNVKNFFFTFIDLFRVMSGCESGNT